MKIINLFLISSIIFLAGCQTSNSPSQAVLKYQELSDRGDFDGAIRLLSERKIRTLGIGQMKQSLIGINEKARLLGEQHTFQIIREDIVGDLAEVDIRVLVKIKDRADTSHVITHKLIKENAQWKIDGFHLNE